MPAHLDLMVSPKLEVDGHTIVFVGALNPQIFQPAWFYNQNLIRKEEAETAKIEIIHREIVTFSTDWFQIQVTPERIIMSTTQAQYYEPLRDLALGTFRVLHHTPITKMGLNKESHFLMASEGAWHAIGDKLGPKDRWRNILEKPGLASFTMQGIRPDQYKGAINVRVEPSTRIKPGIFIQVNDHYELKEGESDQSAEKFLDILEVSWKSSIARSLKIAQTIVESK